MSRRLNVLILCALGSACLLGLSHAYGDSTSGTAGTTGAPTVSARIDRTEAGSSPRDHKAHAPAAIKLAITVDDMPGGGPEVLGYTHVQMVKDIISVLHAHRVQRAAGFVVGSMLETDPSRMQALDAWVQAGFLVGNHSYSHDHIAELGLARYMDDITRNRDVVSALEKRSGQEHSYFRFPYLEEGATHAERRALWQLLQRERYTLVRPSVTFGDTDWADAYLRCQEQNDRDALLALDRSYLSHALAQLHWAVATADVVLGHVIPLVLLVHVNVPTALNLDALLHMYEEQGVQFIGLEEAMREPAYAVHYDVADGDLLNQASTALRRPPPSKLAEPEAWIDRACR